jgi:CHRD domain
MRFHSLAGVFLLAAAVAMPASANVIQYSADLSGIVEIPPNVSPGLGTVLITVDFNTLAMRVEVSFSGLLGNTTASHIHCCTLTPGSTNVMVATQLPNFVGFPLGVTSGTYDHTFDMSLATSYNPAFVTLKGGISGAFDALVDGMATGNAYYNIHTNLFPGGEIRGLLHQVPEPGLLTLLALGLTLLIAARRRGLDQPTQASVAFRWPDFRKRAHP